jgi:protein-tyrosine phosphatase
VACASDESVSGDYVIKVLFVCTGNICRSPMAEAVFRDMVLKAGLSAQVSVDSAGTGNYHVGDRAHPQTLKVLKQCNIPYGGRARQFTDADLDTFDYVLAMDKSNLSHIQRYWHHNRAKISLLLDYAKQNGTVDTNEVPDPYGSRDAAYWHVYDLVTKGCAALLAHIRAEHGL